MIQTQPQNQQLITQLQHQNQRLKQDYQNLLTQHHQLFNKYQQIIEQCSTCQKCYNNINPNKNQQQNENIPINNDELQIFKVFQNLNKPQSTQQLNYRNSIQIQQNIQENIDFDETLVHQHTPQQQQSHNQNINQFQNTSLEFSPTKRRQSSRSSRTSSTGQKIFPLIQGCFIIEKVCKKRNKSKSNLTQMLKFVYPPSLQKTQKQTMELLLKYSFTNPEIIRVQDDMENSRKNQILFGTPYDDYCFGFEDGKWATKRELPEILKSMGTMKKKYYHVLIKPEIVEDEEIDPQGNQNKKEQEKIQIPIEEEDESKPKINTSQNLQQDQGIQEPKTQLTCEQSLPYFYETQIIFGFISSFPLRNFFQDLHKKIQQQLKYSQFKTTETNEKIFDPTQTRAKKYTVMSEIMEKLYENQYKISRFPISHVYNTGVTNISLNIPNVITYRQMEDDFLNYVSNKYDSAVFCRLLHYVLTERCVLIESDNRKALNDIFEAIRIMIRPFSWIFAVVYVYSEYFEPFMSSPMPIIIGKIFNENLQENEQIDRQSLQMSDFCVIRLTELKQLKQGQLFYKTIRRLKKQMDKNSKQRNGLDRATIIHKYVHNLKIFIQKGVLNSQLTDFHMEFAQTQMVSYYKENIDI